MGRQHYMPAGFIGQFGEPGRRGTSPRKRQVWVARRGASSPRVDKAENVGVSRQLSYLYDSNEMAGASLDPTLTRSESVLGYLESFCGRAINEGRVEAEFIVNGMAQFIAGLLTRHPNLATPHWSSLGRENRRSSLKDVQARASAFWRTADFLIFNSKWTIVESRAPLATSDLGFVWFPSDGLGTLHIPVHPYALLQISVGRSYYRGDSDFVIDRKEWSQTRWQESQLALMWQAQEVYAENDGLAELALMVMALEGPLEVGGVDVTCLPDSRRLGFLPTMLGAQDPELAWRRVHLVQRMYVACNCDRDNIRAGMSRAGRRAWSQRMAAVDDLASRTIPKRGVISPWDLAMGPPYSLRPRQIHP